MDVGVIGGSERKDRDYIFSNLDLFLKRGDRIVSGGAEGADKIAGEYVREKKFDLIEFLPDFKNGGGNFNTPYAERNHLIAQQSEVILAFPSKNSSGTYQTIGMAKGMGKRIVIFKVI